MGAEAVREENALADEIMDDLPKLVRDLPAGISSSALQDYYGKASFEINRALRVLKERGEIIVAFENGVGWIRPKGAPETTASSSFAPHLTAIASTPAPDLPPHEGEEDDEGEDDPPPEPPRPVAMARPTGPLPSAIAPPDMTGTERVYAALAARFTPGATFQISYAQIANIADVKESSVNYLLSALVRAGRVQQVGQPQRGVRPSFRLPADAKPSIRPTDALIAAVEAVQRPAAPAAPSAPVAAVGPAKPVTAFKAGVREKSKDSTLTRFASADIDPERVRDLRPDHPMVVMERTIFPTTVVSPWESPRLLVSGHNNAKLGGGISKGPWAGMPLYHLTLEERATCPRSCKQWLSCLVPGTRILTADLRWVPIEALQVGQKIFGFDEYPDAPGKLGHRYSRTAVVEKLGRAIQPSYRIKTDRGEVIASAGHMWLGRPMGVNGRKYAFDWLVTENLKPGQQIRFFAEPWEHDQSYEAGRVRGFVEGEGHVTVYGDNGHTKARMGWAQLPGPLLEEINAIVRAKGFTHNQFERASGVNGSTVAMCDIMGGWREVLRFLGTFRPTRLIERAEEMIPHHSINGRGGDTATILSVEPVGDREVVTIQTSTKTLIAEGLFSHNCYGNAMHMARRHDHRDPEFLNLLEAELWMMQREHRDTGFALRLHTLGDFYDLDYVKFWADALDHFPGLRIFGYTANDPNSKIASEAAIGQAIEWLTYRAWDVFAIRFSRPAPAPQSSVVMMEPSDDEGVIMCPQQREATLACGSCGLCWAEPARDKAIGFLKHGPKSRA